MAPAGGQCLQRDIKGKSCGKYDCRMFRRLVIERVGGFKMACSPSEDVELLLSAARLFPSAHHRTTVAQYRRYPNTLTRKGTVMLPAILRVMRLQDDVVKGEPELLRARRQGVAYWCDYFGRPRRSSKSTPISSGARLCAPSKLRRRFSCIRVAACC